MTNVEAKCHQVNDYKSLLRKKLLTCIEHGRIDRFSLGTRIFLFSFPLPSAELEAEFIHYAFIT